MYIDSFGSAASCARWNRKGGRDRGAQDCIGKTQALLFGAGEAGPRLLVLVFPNQILRARLIIQPAAGCMDLYSPFLSLLI